MVLANLKSSFIVTRAEMELLILRMHNKSQNMMLQVNKIKI